ncbi:MAG TPA: 4-(cytidine 5'-diphospho)-2-C-methyl-D-erythritol kinase [Candidatus Limiplasma sp.]|nr:4-(cytidine 5'-diphospho)-2-C-methyl-D-erythritol kinase [Candidatus Limiplasma sp.]HRX09073.1 4-(cytidine 5'-diphospho)-2-C-methyl-D-erythritol kinase [Candidatus Limiplasma sp.]
MLKLTARAKVNWSLDILGQYDNGYHRMDMLMSSVTLADELIFTPSDSLTLTIEGNGRIPVEDNLVQRAARALQRETGYTGGAEIMLIKRIPHGAGLGGGSADAAATLIGLNRLWKLGLPRETLLKLAETLGADVPFFITGGFARIGGFGEVVSPLPPLPEIPLVILQPCGPQPTREVFALFDTLVKVSHPDTDAALRALQSGDFEALSRTSGNVLQQALEPHLPPINEAIAALDACGAKFATMSGSGSAVFGAFTDSQNALQAQRVLHKRWKKCWACHTHTESITEE